jgi:tricorn protease
VADDGEKALYRQGEHWYIADVTDGPPKPDKPLRTDEMEVRVDPRAEWKQMYRDVWRLQRDFLYDPHAHGLDLAATQKKYAVFLDGIAHRSDLNYLFNEMLGNMVLGHTYIFGGETPEVKKVKGGLLGADYVIDKGRYRFARIYNGESWNPQLRAPLTQPGVNVKAGDYLLAVRGQDLKATDNVYRPFEATAGKAVTIKVGPNADGSGSREVTVVPIESEVGLRNLAWIESNRRKVDKLSGGKLAYVYLPDTYVNGYKAFNRYFFAQLDKEGVVVDERFNGGGLGADYVIEYLKRPLLNYWTTRDGKINTSPGGAIFGPKAMIINEFAGSGGDLMPWYFRRTKVGPLVGKRTWGGLVGIGDYPPLLDGGQVTAPDFAFFTPEGTWDVENHGVAPDVEVEYDPYEVRKGHDPQLEKAVEIVLEELKKNPPKQPKQPAYPNYHLGSGAGSSGGKTASPSGTR